MPTEPEDPMTNLEDAVPQGLMDPLELFAADASSSQSIDTFLLHPLCIPFDREAVMFLATPSIPNPVGYLIRHIRADDPDPEDTHIPTLDQWFNRRRIDIVRASHWILDPECRVVYLLDFVCERGDARPCILFVYYWPHRGGPRFVQAAAYVMRIREVCQRVFHFRPSFTLIHVNSVSGAVYSQDVTTMPHRLDWLHSLPPDAAEITRAGPV